jgi:hypothetical protein
VLVAPEVAGLNCFMAQLLSLFRNAIKATKATFSLATIQTGSTIAANNAANNQN